MRQVKDAPAARPKVDTEVVRNMSTPGLTSGYYSLSGHSVHPEGRRPLIRSLSVRSPVRVGGLRLHSLAKYLIWFAPDLAPHLLQEIIPLNWIRVCVEWDIWFPKWMGSRIGICFCTNWEGQRLVFSVRHLVVSQCLPAESPIWKLLCCSLNMSFLDVSDEWHVQLVWATHQTFVWANSFWLFQSLFCWADLACLQLIFWAFF